MQASQNPNPTPQSPQNLVELPRPSSDKPARRASDRTILRRYQQKYRQTGKCEDLPILMEIARLARDRQLVSPAHAQSLLSDLTKIEETLPNVLLQLSLCVSNLQTGLEGGATLTPKESFELTQTVTQLTQPLERLLEIARDHPDPSEPGVEEGIALCYADTIKHVNDLRYLFEYVTENARPQKLRDRLAGYAHPELQQLALHNAIEELHVLSVSLIPRLRENIARKTPQLWGSFLA